MITGYHNHLDTSGTTASNGFTDTMLGWILKGTKTDKDEIAQRIVFRLLVKYEVLGVLVTRQQQFGKTQHTMSLAGHVLIGFVIGVIVLLCQLNALTIKTGKKPV